RQAGELPLDRLHPRGAGPDAVVAAARRRLAVRPAGRRPGRLVRHLRVDGTLRPDRLPPAGRGGAPGERAGVLRPARDFGSPDGDVVHLHRLHAAADTVAPAGATRRSPALPGAAPTARAPGGGPPG